MVALAFPTCGTSRVLQRTSVTVNTRPLWALPLLLFGALWPCTATALAGQVLQDVRYDVVYNAETALRREVHVEMSFRVTNDSPVALSLPSWTPGAYELSDFAKNVRGLWARQDGSEVRWDKSDFDASRASCGARCRRCRSECT
jgi:hypothetical protein